MDYWMYSFHEQNGEHEYIHRHIYSSKNLRDMNYWQQDDADHRILSAFFLNNITEESSDGSAYWTDDGMRLVEIYSVDEVKPSQFDNLKLAGVYVENENAKYEE